MWDLTNFGSKARRGGEREKGKKGKMLIVLHLSASTCEWGGGAALHTCAHSFSWHETVSHSPPQKSYFFLFFDKKKALNILGRRLPSALTKKNRPRVSPLQPTYSRTKYFDFEALSSQHFRHTLGSSTSELTVETASFQHQERRGGSCF